MNSADELGKRLFQPARPRLRACLDVVRPQMSGREAWETLCRARLVPDTWMEGGRRLFDPVADSNLRVATDGEPDPAPTAFPPTPAACVAIASCEPEAVESAERAALQVFDASDPWRLPTDKQPAARPSLCVWELLPIGGKVRARRIQMIQGRSVFALEAASLAVELHDRGLFERTRASIEMDDEQVAKSVEEATGLRIADATRIQWWRLVRELGLVVPNELVRDHGLGKLPKALRARPFRDLPDFAEALTRVALAGFATGIHGSVCHMFAVRPAWATLERLAGG